MDSGLTSIAPDVSDSQFDDIVQIECDAALNQIDLAKNFPTRPGPGTMLFHYTSSASVIEIIRGRSIWMTHTNHVNDASEVVHGVELINKAITDRVAAGKEQYQVFLQHVHDSFNGWQAGKEHFIFCMSESGDDLAQWRNYGSDGRGFAVGFNFAHSRLRFDSDEHFSLIKVEYEDDKKQELIDTALDKFIALHANFSGLMHDERRKSRSMRMASYSLVQHLMQLRSTFKDACFAAEREWRIVLANRSGSPPAVRARGPLLIRYVNVPLHVFGPNLQADEKYSPLHFVRYGSKLPKADTFGSLLALLMAADYRVVRDDERDTTIPYGVRVVQSNLPMKD